jgi:apolipoprotein N-acyltransferase
MDNSLGTVETREVAGTGYPSRFEETPAAATPPAVTPAATATPVAAFITNNFATTPEKKYYQKAGFWIGLGVVAIGLGWLAVKMKWIKM